MCTNELVMDTVAKSSQSMMTNTRNVRKFDIIHRWKLSKRIRNFLFSVCYLGYGSPAKLLSSSIKKVISVPTELDCKNECVRFRESTSFKCYSFSFG